ncbi:MAG: response regulator [Lewinellaceae bacterium]|nr:response regulator [Lewinellaceae bacterium]
MHLILLPAKNKRGAFLLLLLLFSGPILPGKLAAQSNPPADTAPTLWPRIEAQLEQQTSDTSFYFILQEVRGRCGSGPDCQFPAYSDIMTELERRFNLSGCIYVCEEMVKVARRMKNQEKEAGVYLNLSRYYDALGIYQQTELYADKALAIFEQVGSYFPILKTKMYKLERTVRYRKLEAVLSDMDSLLAEAEQQGDSLAVYHMHARMIGPKIDAGRYEEASRHIAAIEGMPVSRPVRPAVMAKLVIAARARATLALIRKDSDEAERYFQKGLRLCEEEPNPWLEVRILDKLAELEWNRGNKALAKSYVDRAHTRAMEQQIDDLLVGTFEWKAYIAEKEGRYRDALENTRSQFFYKEKFKSRSAGFDLENYYLQLEKKQLEVEKKNKELDLSLKKNQLRNSLIILVLIFWLAAGLIIGLYKQRKGKRALAEQNELIRLQARQLENLDAAKSRFFANISHELRTPLTLMLGPISLLLKENQLGPKQARLLKMARQNGRQLEQLITEILDLRKLEIGKMALDEKPTELAPFFRLHFAQFESLAERKQIDFSFKILTDKGLAANLDQEKCRQILYNLLSNAFKFTPAGGRIRASLAVNESILRLEVADSGPGIHPDDLPHVFNRFYQAPTPPEGEEKPWDTPSFGGGGGTGIGLALCQEYARLFGGQIEVQSTLGEGAVFRVAFPVTLVETPAQAARTEAYPPEALPDDSSQPTVGRLNTLSTGPYWVNSPKDGPPGTSGQPKPAILVAEDNPGLQDYLRLVLSEKYEVIITGNGQAALEALASSPPGRIGLILSDLMMPVMDGYQLLETLKSNDATRHMPVIMLTARADAGDKLKALRIGVDDYLTKPFDEEELMVRIENLLKNQAARLRETPANLEEAEPGAVLSKTDQKWLEAFEAYVRKNLSNDILSVPLLAHEFAMSESTLLRQLKRLAGLSPNQYLQEMRLGHARQLLENRTYNSIARVAAEVGYTDTRSFSRSFKKRFGKLPSDYFSGQS